MLVDGGKEDLLRGRLIEYSVFEPVEDPVYLPIITSRTVQIHTIFEHNSESRGILLFKKELI